MMRLLLIWIMGIGVMAGAEPLRVAVVDLTAVFNAHPDTAQAEVELARARQQARKAFNELANQLKDTLEHHQKLTTRLIEAGADPAPELRARAEALLERAESLEREVAAMRTTQERDLEQGFLAERRRILASISGVIGRFNADARYALILDNSAASANGLPQVLHAPGVDDVTEQIVELVKSER